jgi:hypothetical protein
MNHPFSTSSAAAMCMAMFRGAVDAYPRLLGRVITGFIVSLVSMSGLVAPMTFSMMTDYPSDPFTRWEP